LRRLPAAGQGGSNAQRAVLQGAWNADLANPRQVRIGEEGISLPLEEQAASSPPNKGNVEASSTHPGDAELGCMTEDGPDQR
jgi:hypothetical protein